jgi:hypothetical protein
MHQVPLGSMLRVRAHVLSCAAQARITYVPGVLPMEELPKANR